MPTTRDRLLDAAEELLDAGGVETVTLREVGHRAGVSHNAPYKHFTNKEALLAAIAARELRDRSDRLTAALAGDDPPVEILRQSLLRYAERALAHPNRFKLIYGRWTVHSDELAQAAHAASDQLVAVVRAAQGQGALPGGDPERLMALFRALAHGAADLALAGHLAPDGKGHSDAAGLIDDLFDHLRRH